MGLDCFKKSEKKQDPPKMHSSDGEGSKPDEDNENWHKEYLRVNRELYNHPKFVKTFPIDESAVKDSGIMSSVKAVYDKNLKPSKACGKKQLYNRIPAIKLIKNYRIKEYLLSDLLAGIIVSIMHIPQGMAYALLATLPPIFGLYTSFYPNLVYWLFGTSRHISIGTFSVVALMVGSTLNDLSSKYVPPVGYNQTNSTHDGNSYLSSDPVQARVMLATVNMFCVGCIQLLMFIFNLGFLSSLFSEPLNNGFITGCAVHVFTSQVKQVFGISIGSHVGAFKIPKTYIDIISKLPQTNVVTLIIGVVCIIILYTIKTYINDRYAGKMKIPFPTELMIVVFGTLISYLADFNGKYHVKIVGPIPAGVPGPRLPPFHVLPDMILPSIVIAIVTFSINFSLCDFFAKKQHYKINNNQEFLAYACCNLFSSFFPCFSTGGSLARSCVQYNAGGKTQIVSLVSCVILAFILAFIAPLFMKLPQACLAAIIMVALKTLFMNLLQLKFYWKVNKIEFATFLIAFLSVVILDVDIGLGIGLLCVLVSHMIRSFHAYSTLLGHIPGTELYKDVKLYKNAREIGKIKIVRVQQELHAGNASFYKKSIYELVQLKPQQFIEIKEKIMRYQKKVNSNGGNNLSIENQFVPKFLSKLLRRRRSRLANTSPPQPVKVGTVSAVFTTDEVKISTSSRDISPDRELNEYDFNEATLAKQQNPLPESQILSQHIIIDHEDYADQLDSDFEADDVADEKLRMPKIGFKFLIIDCSPMNFIDTVGVKTMKLLISEFNELGIKVYLADCNDSVRQRFASMEESMSNTKFLDPSLIHLTVHDAVLHALAIRKFNK